MRNRMSFLGRSRSALFAFLLFATLQGCQAVNQTAQPRFNTQQSARDANQSLQASNPTGTRLDEAVRNMEQIGFQCQPLAAAADGYQNSMLCSLSTPKTAPSDAAPPTPVLWTVSLDSEDGQTLSRLVASRTPKDLGE